MKQRSTHFFVACLILAKIALLAFLFVSRQGEEVFLFQKQAMASEEPREVEKPDQLEARAGDPDLSEFKALLRVKKEIEEEKEGMKQEKSELLAVQEQINRKLAELSLLRDEIRTQMETKKLVEEQRLKHLVKAYSAMKPQIAAGLIEQLELPFAVEMLSRMPGDTVGSILSFVNKERAAKICQGLAKP
jgi:flagellar motility protein MotE (MotC chaperone)